MDKQVVEQLEVQDISEFIEQGGLLVDTLVPEHYEARHIPGAVNVCVYEMVFLEAMQDLIPDKGTPIALYGAGPGSQDCYAAAEKLVRAGYSEVAVFPGGLHAWREAGRALEGNDPETVEPPHPGLELESRTYTLVTTESVIKWTGRGNNGGHNGRLLFSCGDLDATADLRGTFSIDMQSIRNYDLEGDELQGVLEKHLRSDDFFFSSMFPEALFTTTRIRLVEDGEATRPNAMIQGELSLRGVKNEIAFPAHIRNIDGKRIAIIANLDFDRTQWGVLYGSSRFFMHLGYHVVYDFISIDFRIVLE